MTRSACLGEVEGPLLYSFAASALHQVPGSTKDDNCKKIATVEMRKDYFSAGSRTRMADCFVPRDLFAMRKCSVIAMRSSWASFRNSCSPLAVNGSAQTCRIRVHSSSIRGSVEVGTINSAGHDLYASLTANVRYRVRIKGCRSHDFQFPISSWRVINTGSVQYLRTVSPIAALECSAN